MWGNIEKDIEGKSVTKEENIDDLGGDIGSKFEALADIGRNPWREGIMVNGSTSYGRGGNSVNNRKNDPKDYSKKGVNVSKHPTHMA